MKKLHSTKQKIIKPITEANDVSAVTNKSAYHSVDKTRNLDHKQNKNGSVKQSQALEVLKKKLDALSKDGSLKDSSKLNTIDSDVTQKISALKSSEKHEQVILENAQESIQERMTRLREGSKINRQVRNNVTKKLGPIMQNCKDPYLKNEFAKVLKAARALS
jgi:hypothetical protein